MNEFLSQFAAQLRRDVLRMTFGASSGHPGGSLGCADLFSLLYNEILRYRPAYFSLNGSGEDVFLLSNGHISPVWYSTLARTGFFDTAELATFRKLDSRLQGHPSPHEGIPGVRIASGSLGQGLSVGIGMALAKRLNGDDHLVLVLMGDGELQEGQIWEAAMYAGSKKVDNLIGIVDYNGIQIDGPVDQVLTLGQLDQKWKSFGWNVLSMNGHDFDDMRLTLKDAINHSSKGVPTVILMNSTLGKGVDFMENNHKWHGSPPNAEQLKTALAQIPETLGDY